MNLSNLISLNLNELNLKSQLFPYDSTNVIQRLFNDFMKNSGDEELKKRLQVKLFGLEIKLEDLYGVNLEEMKEYNFDSQNNNDEPQKNELSSKSYYPLITSIGIIKQENIISLFYHEYILLLLRKIKYPANFEEK